MPHNESLRMQIERSERGSLLTLAVIGAIARDAAEVLHSRGMAWPIALMPRLKDPQTLFRWLRDHVNFRHDPVGVELVHTPLRMLSEMRTIGRAAGDCDDLAALGASILLAYGVPAVLVALSRRTEGMYEHVAFGRGSPADYVLIDPFETSAAGEEVRGVIRRVVVSV